MSLDELRADLTRNMKESGTILDESTRSHLKNTVWPFLEAILDVVEEMDDAVAEMVDQQEDYLQPETAAVFAAVIQSGLQIGAELKKRAAAEPDVINGIAAFEQLCEQAVTVLAEITMIPAEDDGEEDEDEDEATEDGNE